MNSVILIKESGFFYFFISKLANILALARSVAGSRISLALGSSNTRFFQAHPLSCAFTKQHFVRSSGGLFRPMKFLSWILFKCLNPLSAGRSFQTCTLINPEHSPNVLIPYQQGGLFRRTPDRNTRMSYVLIPYQQGGLFRPTEDA